MVYVRYFFTGYRQAGMSAGMIAIVEAIRFILLFLVGSLLQGLINQFSHGDFTLRWNTLQGYVMPAVIVVLGYIWKLTREVKNPFVTSIVKQ